MMCLCGVGNVGYRQSKGGIGVHWVLIYASYNGLSFRRVGLSLVWCQKIPWKLKGSVEGHLFSSLKLH